MTVHEKPQTTHDKDETAERQVVATLQERHPDWPQIETLFYFGPHDNIADMEGIGPYLKDADIYMFEAAASSEFERIMTDRWKKLYNLVATDPPADVETILEKKGLDGTFEEPIIRGIYGTGKAAGSFDVGQTRTEQKIVAEMYEFSQMPVPGTVSYEDALEYYRENFREFSTRDQKREKIMADRFEEEIADILESRPDLKDKENLKVLVSMGAAHTTLRHKMAEKGITSERVFVGGMPKLFDYRHEMIRSFDFAKEPSAEVVERAFCEQILDDTMKQETLGMVIPTDERLLYLRRYVSELEPEEMTKIFELWSKGMAKIANIDALLVPAEMPPLARKAKDVMEANKLFESQKHNLAKVALKS